MRLGVAGSIELDRVGLRLTAYVSWHNPRTPNLIVHSPMVEHFKTLASLFDRYEEIIRGDDLSHDWSYEK